MSAQSHLLVVRTAGFAWGLPMDAVEQTFRLDRSPTCTAGNARVVLFRGDTIELHDLATALGEARVDPAEYGVVLWAGGRRRVFAVEKLVGQMVVERLELPASTTSPYCSGVVLVDGEIVPIIEPGAIVGAWRIDGGSLGYSEMQRSALAEIGNIGSSHAATALSELLGKPVEIAYTEALIATLAEAADRVGAAAEPSAVVDTPMANNGGRMLLLFPEEAAEQLCNLLGTSLDDDLGRSALTEVGNILASSYLNALVEMTGLPLEPEPPEVEIDLLGRVVEKRLTASADPNDPTILMRSCLTVESSDARFAFLFVPQLEEIGQLLDALGVGAAA